MHKYWKFLVFLSFVVLTLIFGFELIERFIAYREFKNVVKNMEAVQKTVTGKAQYADLLLYGFQIVIPPGWYATSPKGTESMKALPDDAFVMTNYPPVTTSFFQYLLHRPARQPNAILIRITFEKQTKHSLETLKQEIENKHRGVTRFLYPSVETTERTLNGYNTLLIHQKDDLGEVIELIGPNSNRFTITIKTQDGLSKNREIIDEILSSLILLDEKSRADTSRWSRFEHKLNFSIDVPPTYSIPSEPQRVTDEDGTLAEKWEFIPTDRKNYFSFSIWVSEDSPFKSIEGWKEKSSFLKTHRFSDEKTVSIAEYPVFQYKAHPCESNATCSSHILSYGLIFYIDSTMVHVRSDNLRILAATVDEAENIFDISAAPELFNRIVSTLGLPSRLFVTPTESPPSKPFTSRAVGISFSYPSRVHVLSQDHAVTVKEFTSGPDLDIKTVLISAQGVFDSYAGYGITRFKNQNNVTPESWWNENFDLILRDRYVGSQSKDRVTFEAKSVTGLPLVSYQGAIARGFIYQKGNDMYLFRDFAYHEDEKIANAILQAIIPTLRFSE